MSVGTVAVLALGLATSPSRAGDDGAAPIWTGIATVFGPYLGFEGDKDPPIDYRDRGRLVLPPKIALPPPSASAATGDVDWPVDPDVQKLKKAKQDQKAPPNKQHYGRYTPPAIGPGSKVTMTATAGEGAGDAPPCPKDAAPGACSRNQPSNYGHATPNFNPLTWVGLEKKAPTVLGPEPDREDLTDPPKGLRAPAGGPGVKVEN